MNESLAILHGFESLCAEQKASALATIIRVSGSSYRRPGARMLVAGDGRTWGGVSGGCLEKDVARRGRQVIDSGVADLRRYDTTDDFDSGAALGCAGLIEIFIERLSAENPGPFPALRTAQVHRQTIPLATIIKPSANGPPAGTRIDLKDATSFLNKSLSEFAESGIGGMRSCEGAEVFFELHRPPQSLVLFGGGPDVVPVVAIAKALGWHVTVIASHATVGYRDRFSTADRVAVGTEDDPFGAIAIEPDSAVVLMTHNYPRDLQLLPSLLAIPLKYLGILGPRRRAERLVLECPGVAPDAIQQLHAPVGLDIGAEIPEAIALSILSEIQAVLAGRSCASLRDRTGPIYASDSLLPGMPYHPAACPVSA